jgi:hypothetical protein
MEVIGVMNDVLQLVIPNQVGVYDDAFNLNCVGDTFQSNNIPTILFEAGHFANDYAREQTREYIYLSLIASLNYIAKNDVDGKKHKSYFKIPENDKCFYDIIIRNAKTNDDSGNRVEDIGIMYQEKLVEGKINFIPKIEKIENLNAFFGHKEIEAKKTEVLDNFKQPVKVNNENVFVMINNEKISLLLK